MKLINRETLKEMAQVVTDPSVSIYIPTFIKGNETEQNSIRLKNALREAEQQILDRGMRKQDAQKMFNPAWDLVHQKDFWEHQNQGLAVFITPESFLYVNVHRDCREQVVVSNRFFLKPLIADIQFDAEFYLLALNIEKAELYKGSGGNLQKIELPGVPASLHDVIKYDDEERQLQFHSAGDGQRAMYHGQEGEDRYEQERMDEYITKLSKGVTRELHKDSLPLVLCGLEEITAIYKKVNEYRDVVETIIAKNPRDMSAPQMYEQAGQILEDRFKSSYKQTIERYYDMTGSDKRNTSIADIVPASFNKRVESLIIPVDKNMWGRLNDADHSVEPHSHHHPMDVDLYDLAASQVLVNGGGVYAVPGDEIPSQSNVVALYRY